MDKPKNDWFDSHLIITGPGLSAEDRQFIKDTIRKKCAKPIAKLKKGGGSEPVDR